MDRRTVWAILLMMVIAIAPAILIKARREAYGASFDALRTDLRAWRRTVLRAG